MNNLRYLPALLGYALVLALVLIGAATALAISPMLAAIAWSLLLSVTIDGFLVGVPQQTALVLVNSLTGSLREVSTGLVIKLPWENAPMDHFLELQTLTLPLARQFVAADGPVITFGGAVHYRIVPGQGIVVLTHSETAFTTGIENTCYSFISDYISQRSAKEVRANASQLERQLQQHLASEAQGIRRSFGVEPVLVSLPDIAFEAQYQKARTESSVATELASARSQQSVA